MAAKKITKKASPKKPSEKIIPVMPQPAFQGMQQKRWPLAIGIVLVVILALIYLKRGLFVAATVNGHPISRMTVIRELEKHSGQQALDSLINKQLILEAAAKKGVTVTSKEVDGEISNIKKSVESQGQKFDQLLVSQGITEEDLRSQIQVSKTLEKLLKNDIKVSDDEIAKFIEANKAAIPEGTDKETVKKNAMTQLQQQKLSQKAQELIATLKKQAQITYFVKY